MQISIPGNLAQKPMLVITPGGASSTLARCARMIAMLTSISLASCHSSSNDDGPSDDPAGLPSPPVNLVGLAYSDNEIRLAWGPAVDDGWVTGYEIKRDGVTLSTNEDSLFYHDTDVVALTTYVYSVSAIDNEGNRSSAAILSLSSLATTPTLNQGNYIAIIGAAFDAYRGTAYDPDLLLHSAAYHKENNPISTDYEYLDSGAVFRALYEFECANGGTASVIVVPYLSSDREVATTFDNCLWNSAVYDGLVTWFWPPHNESQSSYRFDNLSIDRAISGYVSADGSIGIDSAIIGSVVHQGEYHLWSSFMTSYQWNGNDLDELVIGATDTHFGYGRDRVGNPVAKINGSLTLKSPLTGNKPLTVTIPEEFTNTNSSDRFFQVGEMHINADDGSAIRLKAITADPTRVSVSLTVDGATQSFDIQWETWYPNLTFEQISGDTF